MFHAGLDLDTQLEVFQLNADWLRALSRHVKGQTESHYPPPLSDADFALVKYMLDRELAHAR